ncbi:MAG: hypothetical protein CVV64_16930 [Candidatus Wallbacteria bacterium HGW-Wallbacteria-1]|jgi:hypothetical protein|uniref:Peptidase S8/S53 domain-containing protein n=1 Tax=Candidatus Wallbacteria bacterium HGW-Wallbacteria-1 TaxID=2013854 RepID=A0A2N1PKL9_9BACT|nr:MAG: hypothetical protein CVV64_16930 [Candidatus Wallbacteria bacterium HGW-Wallbacteria-1]
MLISFPKLKRSLSILLYVFLFSLLFPQLTLTPLIAGDDGQSGIYRISASESSVKRQARIFSDESLKSQPEYVSWGPARIASGRVNQKLGITGSGVRVGIIDTGIDGNHPDFKGKILKWRDFFDNPSALPVDNNGHGTHVAGIIAGGPRCGVAPGASLIVARVFDPPRRTTAAMIISALQWMADPDGNPETPDQPHIVNCSWGNDVNDDDTLKESISALAARGILVVAEVSDRGGAGCGSPANFGEVLAVGALTRNDRLSYWTSWGVSPFTYRRKPDMAAPGENIFSCWNNGGYTMKDGPSTSAALVSGVAALTLSASILKNGKPLQLQPLREILLSSADKLTDPYVGEKAGKGIADSWESVLRAGDMATLKVNVTAPARWADCETPITVSIPELELREPAGSTFQLKPAEWNIRASSFGWVSTTVNTDVEEADSSLDLVLEPAPLGELNFQSEGFPGQSPEWVEIFFEPSGAAEARGVWNLRNFPQSLQAPAGIWNIRISCQGYFPIVFKQIAVEKGSSLSIATSFRALPALLWVDDDRLTPCSDAVAESLSRLGMEHHVYEYVPNNGGPSARFMAQFDTVIWTLGNRLGNVFTQADLEEIEKYIAQGGNFMASGQDLAWYLGKDALFRKIFQTGLKHDDGLVRTVEGIDSGPLADLRFEIDATEKWQIQFSPDSVYPLPMANSAITLLKYSSSGNFVPGDAAIGVEADASRVILLAFGLEGISDPLNRAQLIRSSLKWLGGDRRSALKKYFRLMNSSVDPAVRELLLSRIVQDSTPGDLLSLLNFLRKNNLYEKGQPLVEAIMKIAISGGSDYEKVVEEASR